MPFKPGTPKPIGSGRKIGTKNKATTSFAQRLDSTGFDIVQAAIQLYAESESSPLLRFKILELLSSYSFSKPRESQEPEMTENETIDVTPIPTNELLAQLAKDGSNENE